MSKSKTPTRSEFVIEGVKSLANKRIRLLRLISQITFFVLLNGVIIGLSKIPLPVPFAFPSGAPFGTVFGGLDAIQYVMTAGNFPFLAFGIFFLTAATVGKLFCGWACPVGFWQDILSWMPVSKIKVSGPANKDGKQYAQVILFVVLFWSFLVGSRVKRGEILVEQPLTRIPFQNFDPFGILFVSWYYVLSWDVIPKDSTVFDALDTLQTAFVVKTAWLLIVAIVSIKIPRFYCRWVCPTGALLGVMSAHSILTVKRNPVKCVDGCTKCEDACPMGVPILDEPAKGIQNNMCISCGNCIDACPDAMSFGIRL